MQPTWGAKPAVLLGILAAGIAVIAIALLLLGSRAAPSPSGSRATPALATGQPTAPASTAAPGILFVGAGDIADCDSDGDDQTAAILDGLPAAQVFTLGDNAYPDGTPQQFEACYGPSWGRHRDRTWPSPGNHDYRTGAAAGYFGYFGDRAGPAGLGWYAFDLGAWRIYSLNSNCSAIGGCRRDSRQLAWLRQDLAEQPRRCVLAYWHHPRYSSGDHGDNTSVDLLWETLVDAGAELALAGHDHSYERFEPVDGGGRLDRARGLTSFVVGTGGRSHYTFDEVLPISAARSTGVWGVLELTLSPDAWSSRFIPVAGGEYADQASGACH